MGRPFDKNKSEFRDHCRHMAETLLEPGWKWDLEIAKVEAKKRLKSVNSTSEFIEVFNWAFVDSMLGTGSPRYCFFSIVGSLPESKKSIADEAERALKVKYPGDQWYTARD